MYAIVLCLRTREAPPRGVASLPVPISCPLDLTTAWTLKPSRETRSNEPSSLRIIFSFSVIDGWEPETAYRELSFESWFGNNLIISWKRRFGGFVPMFKTRGYNRNGSPPLAPARKSIMAPGP